MAVLDTWEAGKLPAHICPSCWLPRSVQMRTTRGSIADVAGGSEQVAPLGIPEEPFTFESHSRAHGVRVTTAGTSSVDKGGVAEVSAFLRRCVPA